MIELSGVRPVSVTLIGFCSVPSVRSVKLSATFMPSMRRYSPVPLVKRVDGELVASLNHAFHMPPSFAASAARWQESSAFAAEPKLGAYEVLERNTRRTHWPAAHAPLLQLTPHMPQFLGSVSKSVVHE